MAEASLAPLLELEGVCVRYNAPVRAVKNVSLVILAGDAIGIVGESGSGKSTLARSILGLLPANARTEATRIAFEGKELGLAGRKSLRGRHVAMVFQDPLSYLNPLMSVERQIGESIRLHDPAVKLSKRTIELLELVKLPSTILRAYPHEMSGGMRQRALLAIALACRPKLLIADEPTTALDVKTQGEILDLINAVRRELGTALLLITHDLGAVASTTDAIHVMLRGEIVESGSTRQILRFPQHPYTSGLVRASRGDRDDNGRFVTAQAQIAG